MKNILKSKKLSVSAIVLSLVMVFSLVSQPLYEVEAAHMHIYKVVSYNKSGFVKHTKKLKCSCGSVKNVTETCSKMKQVGGIKGYYFILLPGTPGKDHSHNMKCGLCGGISNMGCANKKCK